MGFLLACVSKAFRCAGERVWGGSVCGWRVRAAVYVPVGVLFFRGGFLFFDVWLVGACCWCFGKVCNRLQNSCGTLRNILACIVFWNRVTI